jgi:hypothetical protein
LGINVTWAWEKGFHGKGVTVAIISDGIDVHHQDLIASISAEGSRDFTETHPIGVMGTGLAGIIGSRGNNSICGVGIAYECDLANVILVEAATSTVKSTMESTALNYKWDVNSIYIGGYLLDVRDSETVRRVPGEAAEVVSFFALPLFFLFVSSFSFFFFFFPLITFPLR